MTIRFTVGTLPPFRLDLTVAALQRRPENPVDVWRDGAYLRAFATPRGPVVWRVVQPGREPRVRAELAGPVGDPAPWRALLVRMLGLDRDLRPFHAAACRVPGLAELARTFRGVKPPRFASLWEAFVGSVLFQQLSLASGMAAVRRLVARFGTPVLPPPGAPALACFPPAERVAAAREDDLRALGLSGAKARALRGLASAVLDGWVSEADLAALPTDAAAARLRALPGIGPWTAALVLLRGLGRLDVFPAGDAGAARGLAALFGDARRAADAVHALGDWRGMLYFHLLLGGLTPAPPGSAGARRRPRPGPRSRAR